MDISIWYVYLDSADQWLVNPVTGGSHKSISHACEFTKERDAERAAERWEGMVLGWAQ